MKKTYKTPINRAIDLRNDIAQMIVMSGGTDATVTNDELDMDAREETIAPGNVNLWDQEW